MPTAVELDGDEYMLEIQADLFEQTWRAFNERRIPMFDRDHVASPGRVSPEVERHFLDAPACRVLQLDALTPDDHTYLQALAIDAGRLHANLERSMLPGGRSSSDPRAFQLSAVRTGSVYAICPFSGRLVRSRTSIAVTREVVFYRFTGREVFYIATSHLGGGFCKGAIYFPLREMIVKAHDFVWELRQEHVTKLKVLMVSSAASVARYCNAESKRSGVAVSFGDANYAHHLWNELSGILRLRRANGLRRVDRWFVFREPLGPVGGFFRQLRAARIRHVEASREIRDYVPAAMFGEIVERGYFLVNVGDEYIAEELVRRLRRTFVRVPRDKRAAIRRARRAHWPLVLVTIRTGNRTWPDQAAGLATILLRLGRRYPHLGVVIDGYSLAVDYTAQTALHPWLGVTAEEARILAAESDVVREMTDRLGAASIAAYSTSGISLLESAIWACTIDFYVSHAGSNQHKAGWIGNKPGIVHSNEAILRRMYSRGSYYDRVREFGIPPVFFDPHFVTDAAPADRSESDLRTDLANYHVDVVKLGETVEAMADELAARRSGLPAVLNAVRELRRRFGRSEAVHDARLRLRRSALGKSLRALRGRRLR